MLDANVPWKVFPASCSQGAAWLHSAVAREVGSGSHDRLGNCAYREEQTSSRWGHYYGLQRYPSECAWKNTPHTRLRKGFYHGCFKPLAGPEQPQMGWGWGQKGDSPEAQVLPAWSLWGEWRSDLETGSADRPQAAQPCQDGQPLPQHKHEAPGSQRRGSIFQR